VFEGINVRASFSVHEQAVTRLRKYFFIPPYRRKYTNVFELGIASQWHYSMPRLTFSCFSIDSDGLWLV